MRVLAGGPARETESDVFQLHREGLEAQGTDLKVHHELVPDIGGDRWFVEKIRNVAKARQKMMEKTRAPVEIEPGVLVPGCYDNALFMVDTDVIVGPGVLERMLAVDADVVFGVYWTPPSEGWDLGIGPMPQVWDRHPYGWTPPLREALWLEGTHEIPVLGGGACTLIRGRGFESHYWPLLSSLESAGGMWPGEDRSYCIGCEARGIEMVAVTGLPIAHIYKDTMSVAQAREEVGL